MSTRYEEMQARIKRHHDTKCQCGVDLQIHKLAYSAPFRVYPSEVTGLFVGTLGSNPRVAIAFDQRLAAEGSHDYMHIRLLSGAFSLAWLGCPA